MNPYRRPADHAPATRPRTLPVEHAVYGTGRHYAPPRTIETHVTRDHEIIRRWAEQRGARPATTPGSEYDGHVGVLRFDFPGYGGAVLRPVDWEDWFAAFDARRMEFRYQDRRADGSTSNFNRLESPADPL